MNLWKKKKENYRRSHPLFKTVSAETRYFGQKISKPGTFKYNESRNIMSPHNESKLVNKNDFLRFPAYISEREIKI